MTARNAPCPCGSGKKFKHCHGENSARPEAAQANIRDAISAYQRGQLGSAIELATALPDSIDKFRLLSHCLIALRKPSDLKSALNWLTKWQKREPLNPDPLKLRLEVNLFRQDFNAAGEVMSALEALLPGSAEIVYFRAVLSQLTGSLPQALQLYKNAIQKQRSDSSSEPLDPHELAVAAAMQCCETSAGNYPGSPRKNSEGMFDAQVELNLLEKSLLDWEAHQKTSKRPTSKEVTRAHAGAWYNLGCAALAGFTGNDRSPDLFQKALNLEPTHILARFNRVFSCNYSTGLSPKQIFTAHLEAARWLENHLADEQPKTVVKQARSDSGHRIRLAYLSSDFRSHSVAHFILPVLEHHDRQKFEIFLYHNHAGQDDFTFRAKTHADHFRNISRLSDPDVVQIIQRDGIDVLIDLNGLTQNHRLNVIARRVAPVQMTWLGYPNTTGLSTVDYRIVDEITDPPGTADEFCSETLLRLTHPFLVYAPPSNLPEVSALPCLNNGNLTLGSFNALQKLNPPLIQCWSEILKQIPGSKILIKNTGMDFPKPREQIIRVFAAAGIGSERLSFKGILSSQTKHLETYHHVDISLDSFPYHGTTTTCDSLIMGVPVVTRSGPEHRSRVGSSLLSSVGLESLVANDENSLIETVVSLAFDTDRLGKLRSSLRENLLTARLTDASGFTKRLELEITLAWDRWRSNMDAT